MVTTIPSKDLLSFLKKYRGTDEVTWEEAAEKAHKQFGLVSKYGTPYTGIGFQCYVQRKTGQKKWGRQMRPFTKGSFQRRNVVSRPILLITEKKKAALKPKTTAVPVVAPVPASAVAPTVVPTVDALDLVKAVACSDMDRNSKVYLVQRLAQQLK
jgi:hypothetical protein